MTIIPAQSTLTEYDLAVPLPRYAAIIQYPECSFFGVQNGNDADMGCQQIWSKQQRDMVAKYLGEAQDEIEQVVGYPLSPKWFVNERHNYSYPVQADWGKVIEAGVKAVTTISLTETVDYTADPSVVGPIPTTVTDINEIVVFHPGTDVTIIPSAITIAGGNVTIEIPRCRLVNAASADNPDTGLDYNDVPPSVTSAFEAEVDVKRVYTDTSVNATLVWPHSCSLGCAANGCAEYTQTACMYIRNARIGSIDVRPAAYSGGSWVGSSLSCCRGCPEIIRLNYKAGMTPLTPQAEDAIVRLAHSKMPNEVCGCETWTRLWRRDREVPTVLTRERLNCPFGLNEGAWIAWRFTQMLKLVRGDTL